MNKQKDRYTPFKGAYRMPVDEFCNKYGLSLKVIMHRMNVLYWEDFDSLVIPENLGDTSADKIRRVLTLSEEGWNKPEIKKRVGVPEKVIDNILLMDDYMKDVFTQKMKNYFFLDPKKIDISKIFKEVDIKERVKD
jgi:hypothetical protein